MPVKKKRSKKKTGATRHTQATFSGLQWMGMGLLVGLFVAFLVYLDKIPTEEEQNTVSQQKKPATGKSESTKTSPPKHKFDFYTVLPDREVEVPKAEPEKAVRKKTSSKTFEKEPVKTVSKASVKTPAKKTTPPPKSQSTSMLPGLYQLQVGAFKELSKADAMKARLAFMGVESNIQVIQNQGQKMYRVRVGPSTDGVKIDRIQKQLKAKNINTFKQKLKT